MRIAMENKLDKIKPSKTDWFKAVAIIGIEQLNIVAEACNISPATASAAGKLLVVSSAESYLGITLSQVMSAVMPVAAVVGVAGSAAGYAANKYNQSNLEQQAPIKKEIEELTQKKSSLEGDLDKGNKNARYKCRKKIEAIDSQLLAAQEQLKALGSSSVTKMAAGAFDSTIGKAFKNITNAYSSQDTKLSGALHAGHEVAKYVNAIPGIGGYAKAAVQVASGNFSKGITTGVIHAFTGGSVSLSDKLVKTMAKTTAEELRGGIVPVIIKATDKAIEPQNTTAHNP
jgi:hypothetical protein